MLKINNSFQVNNVTYKIQAISGTGQFYIEDEFGNGDWYLYDEEESVFYAGSFILERK